MVFKRSMVTVLVLMYAMSLKVVEACQPGAPPDQPLAVPQQNVEQALVECLKTLKIQNMTAVQDIKTGDVRCVLKNYWIQGKTAQVFDDGKWREPFPATYKYLFTYPEPQKGQVDIHKNCTKMAAGSADDKKDFIAVAWFCVDYCENACKEKHTLNEYPAKRIECGPGNTTKKGCEEERVCRCFGRDGKKCGEKTITFKDIVVTYNDTCLNCFNNRTQNLEDPTKRCYSNLKNWQNYKEGPGRILPVFADSWKGVLKNAADVLAAQKKQG